MNQPTDRKSWRLSRRQFLGATSSSFLLAACGGGPEPAPAADEPAQQPVAAEAQPAAGAVAAPSQYQEPPVLTALVNDGSLPPLEERLPQSPLVVDRTGKYGGTLRTATNEVALFPWSLRWAGAMQGTPLRISPDLQGYVPNVAESVEISSDFRTVDVFMREGLRWSDGELHTADDWLFWYEDVLNNTDITPVPGQWFTVGNQMMDFTKLDDYSFRLEFHAPNPTFPLVNFAHVFGFWDDNALPAHYLRQFHLRYNEDVEAEAEENQFDFWYQYFGNRRNPNQNPDVPRLGAFIVSDVTPQAVYYKRNPYYWMVDSEGKQLPYIDEIVMERVDDLSVIEAKAVAGNYDYVTTGLQVNNFRTYKDAEERGGFRALVWKSGVNNVLYNFNANYPDEEYRKIFADDRFRKAMSVAIDRAEINEVVYFGLGTPAQLTAHPTSRAYNEEYAQAWAQYDPDLANSLLDELGLEWDSAGDLRLLPDGRPFQITYDTQSISPVHEMTREYWRAVGIQIDFKTVMRSILGPRILSNDMMMSTWTGDEIMDVLLLRRPKWFAPIYGDESVWAPLWGQWYQTDGVQGEEPPDEIKQLYEWLDLYAETDDVQYVNNILASQAENIWTIGTIVDGPSVIIASEKLKNIPDEDFFNWDALWGVANYFEAWYLDE